MLLSITYYVYYLTHSGLVFFFLYIMSVATLATEHIFPVLSL